MGTRRKEAVGMGGKTGKQTWRVTRRIVGRRGAEELLRALIRAHRR